MQEFLSNRNITKTFSHRITRPSIPSITSFRCLIRQHSPYIEEDLESK